MTLLLWAVMAYDFVTTYAAWAGMAVSCALGVALAVVG